MFTRKAGQGQLGEERDRRASLLGSRQDSWWFLDSLRLVAMSCQWSLLLSVAWAPGVLQACRGLF